jgi:hypothetical protein
MLSVVEKLSGKGDGGGRPDQRSLEVFVSS